MKKSDKKESSKVTKKKPVKIIKTSKIEKVSNSKLPAVSSNRPLGVKIIAIIEYILAALCLLVALRLFSILSYLQQLPLEFQAISALAFGILSLILAIVFFVIAFYLWKMKNWARVAHLVFYAFLFVAALVSLISGLILSLIDVLVWGLILWYLGFNKDVIGVFKK